MTLQWQRIERPTWTGDLERIVGSAEPGVFELAYRPGENLPGDWWQASDDTGGGALGFGWMDVGWGEAEILLAVDPAERGRGVGSFVLGRLEQEAVRRGLNYVFNTVAATHPSHDEVHDWLGVRGYRGRDDDRALRKLVSPDGDRQSEAAQPRTVDLSADPGTGDEENGGYVDAEEHRY